MQLKVMSQLSQVNVAYLPYFLLCREIRGWDGERAGLGSEMGGGDHEGERVELARVRLMSIDMDGHPREVRKAKPTSRGPGPGQWAWLATLAVREHEIGAKPQVRPHPRFRHETVPKTGRVAKTHSGYGF
jgi:hypothetical protein